MQNVNDMEKIISSKFPDAAGNSNVLTRLESLLVSFADSVEDLFAKWETYALKQGFDAKVTDADALDSFQSYLETSARSAKSKKPRLMPRQLYGDSFASKFKLDIKTEPFDAVTATNIVYRYNEAKTDNNERKPSATANFTLNSDIKAFARHRPFNAPLKAVSAELDTEIENVLDWVCAAHNLNRSDFVSPHQISQHVGWAVGRVVREPPQIKTVEEAKEYRRANRKLDNKSVLLESSRRLGSGSRTSLDLSLVEKSVRPLFEGQIIVVKGSNPKGEQFVVNEFVELPTLSVARVASSKQGDGPVRVAVARAPSSSASLEALSRWVVKQPVSVLLLAGPLIELSTVSETSSLSDEKARVRDALRKLSRNVQIPIVLIPSPDDAFTVDPVFPQPPFPDSELLVDRPLVRVSNPCTFSVDEVALTVAINSALTDLDMYSLDEAFQTILRQRRLYPVYPPPSGRSIDVSELNLANIGPVAPNVLILPSANGKTSCHYVDEVLCVAIGELEEGFAVLTVDPGNIPVASRIGVDVLKFV